MAGAAGALLPVGRRAVQHCVSAYVSATCVIVVAQHSASACAVTLVVAAGRRVSM